VFISSAAKAAFEMSKTKTEQILKNMAVLFSCSGDFANGNHATFL
jgi:hypothetical protein